MRLNGVLRMVALCAVFAVVLAWFRGASFHHVALDLLRLELALLVVWTGWLALAALAWLCTSHQTPKLSTPQAPK